MPDKNNLAEQGYGLQNFGDRGFFDKSSAIRYSMLGLFTLSLFIYLHFREVQVEVPDLNSFTENYIVSQVDFNFPDDEATVLLRQEALREIGKVYQIVPADIYNKKLEFENFLLYNQAWNEQSASRAFQELYQASEAMETALLQLRLTDSHTLEKMKELDFPTQNILIYTPNTLFEQALLPGYIWEEIKKRYFPTKSYDSLVSALIVEFFKASHWHIEEDAATQRSLRKRIQSEVPETMTHVSAGNRIIDQGERVTPRHIAMLMSMKEALAEKRRLSSPLTLLGSLLLTVLFMGIFTAYFKNNFPGILASNRKLTLLITILIIAMGLSKLTEFFILNSKNSMAEIFRYPILVPLAAILIASLLSTAVATFTTGFFAAVSAFALAFDWEGFLVLNLVASIVAVLSTHSLRHRKQIFLICAKAWGAAVIAIVALHLYTNHFNDWSVLTDTASAGFFMILTAVLVVGLLPLLEACFKVMTDVSLIEYMDPNNDLLRRLTIEAPGTYQHSVVVGNLAEAAALAIGSNGLFCRAATLYHDVGKIVTSQYFTENQLDQVNIHQLLTPQESAHVIMAHVPEGVILAREAGLPEPFIDIIKEHHGTTLVYYFYRKQLEKEGGDKSKVDEREFRYDGPKPHSKESAIIMIADSFEAASRSLEKLNDDTLTELINRIVREKLEDGQFDHCPLSLEDLYIVKRTLVKTLLAAGHSRVKYPVQERKSFVDAGEAIP